VFAALRRTVMNDSPQIPERLGSGCPDAVPSTFVVLGSKPARRDVHGHC